MSAAASGCCQVTTTLPDRALADRIASTVVDARLAACAQVIGPLTSTYQWQGRMETAEEWYCFLKTTEEKLPALEARLRELHPYEVPEIIAVPIAGGDPAYLRWIRNSVEPPR
jgi:periplasmic divalent cation tolerance protein